MKARDKSWADAVALRSGLVAGLAVYGAVAPFICAPSGSCEGIVAFHYQPDSAGHFQAVGAAVLVGAAVGLLLWTSLGRGGAITRAVVTVLLIAGSGISLLSQSVLIFLGPLVTGVFLWFMWAPRSPAQRAGLESSRT